MYLYNSLSKQKEILTPLQKNSVRMYTCGPTVYNYAHIGNFFAYITADTLYRWLKFAEQYEVKWVMNITDIDDKTIRDSKIMFPEKSPKDALQSLCLFYEEAFWKDMEELFIERKSFFANPRATEYIKGQQELVRKLYKNGFAYVADDGSVYFSISKYKQSFSYGRLVQIDAGFQDGARVNSDEYDKDQASDFVLWKGKKEGEPFWDFILDETLPPFPGRPGWHLECSAMEAEILSLPFDIHTGGIDLKFPHHEDEIAQSCGGYGIDPTSVWVHNGHLMIEGEKMSKSKNNFYRLKDIKDLGIHPDAFRLLMVTSHYRNNFNFTKNGIHAVAKHLADIRNTYQQLTLCPPLKSAKSIQNIRENFYEAMRDDLNTPKAWSFVLEVLKCAKETVKEPTSYSAQEILQFFDFASQVFGVDFSQKEIVDIPENLLILLDKRNQAKAEKDFSTADALRAEIEKAGYKIKDSREGSFLEKI